MSYVQISSSHGTESRYIQSISAQADRPWVVCLFNIQRSACAGLNSHSNKGIFPCCLVVDIFYAHDAHRTTAVGYKPRNLVPRPLL